MKTTKRSDFIVSPQRTFYQSYHQGWAKALENFDKNMKEYHYPKKPYFQLHPN